MTASERRVLQHVYRDRIRRDRWVEKYYPNFTNLAVEKQREILTLAKNASRR